MVKEQTESFFGDNSPLRNANVPDGVAFKYEPRQQQVDMAYAVADAFDNNENLCIEAPTGVGKTFAYLVPAFFHACQTDKPVVITTIRNGQFLSLAGRFSMVKSGLARRKGSIRASGNKE